MLLGIMLQKIYFKILFASICVLLLINVVTFLIGFNPKQLINPSFYDERVMALYFLGKNFVVETGINMEDVTQDDIDILIDKAVDIYGVDKNMLSIIISKSNQYGITLTGGMGLTAISIYDFLNSSFSNPYNFEENIMAASETIAKLKNQGLSDEEIIVRFVAGDKIDNVKVLAGQEYDRAYALANMYRINHAGIE